MKEKKLRLYTRGTASTTAEWDGPGMEPVAPGPGGGRFDPCGIYEALACILSKRGAGYGVGYTLKGVRYDPSAAACAGEGRA